MVKQIRQSDATTLSMAETPTQKKSIVIVKRGKPVVKLKPRNGGSILWTMWGKCGAIKDKEVKIGQLIGLWPERERAQECSQIVGNVEKRD